MLDFRPLQPEDRERIQTLTEALGDPGCEYSISCLILWYSAQITRCAEATVLRVFHGGVPAYLFPLGCSDLKRCLAEMRRDCRERGIPFRITGLTPLLRDRLAEAGDFVFQPKRSDADYLYTVEALAGLAGKKLQAKRNHINRFVEQYPDWVCEPITAETMPECAQMTKEWYREHIAAGYTLDEYAGEEAAIAGAFENFDRFGFDSLLLRADGEVVAYTFGLPLTRTVYDVNIEKAYSSIPGAYAMINREFSRLIREKYPEIEFLNREDDLGSEGLRKAKLSYHPAVLLEKWTAVLPEDAP